MSRLLMPAPLLLVLGGCLIYDEEVIVDDKHGKVSHEGVSSADGTEAPDLPNDSPDESVDPGGGASSDEEPAPPPGLGVFPSGGATGQTVIVSVVVDIDRSNDIDLTQVTGIALYGPSDIDIVVDQERDLIERLLVLEIAADSALGNNDVLVEFVDGTAIYLENAFEIVADPADAPADHYVGDACE